MPPPTVFYGIGHRCGKCEVGLRDGVGNSRNPWYRPPSTNEALACVSVGRSREGVEVWVHGEAFVQTGNTVRRVSHWNSYAWHVRIRESGWVPNL